MNAALQAETARLPELARITDDAWPLPPGVWARPRSAATYTRVIEKCQRLEAVELIDVLRAGALNPAVELEASVPEFRTKGRLTVGADADIIVFAPARIRATATLDRPAALATAWTTCWPTAPC